MARYVHRMDEKRLTFARSIAPVVYALLCAALIASPLGIAGAVLIAADHMLPAGLLLMIYAIAVSSLSARLGSTFIRSMTGIRVSVSRLEIAIAVCLFIAVILWGTPALAIPIAMLGPALWISRVRPLEADRQARG